MEERYVVQFKSISGCWSDSSCALTDTIEAAREVRESFDDRFVTRIVKRVTTETVVE